MYENTNINSNIVEQSLSANNLFVAILFTIRANYKRTSIEKPFLPIPTR